MSIPEGAPERPDLRSQEIYQVLREGIIRGRYPQGSRLTETRLAEELGVSRISLREALPRLAFEGFVCSLPRRSAAVTTWTERSTHDLFDLRLCLEVGAARFAAARVAASAEVTPLVEALERSRDLVAAGDPYSIAEGSIAFHETVVELTGNALMSSTMRTLSGRMMWLFYMTSDLDPAVALAGHEEVLASIASGNERLAEAVAYAHIERDRDESLVVLARHRLSDESRPSMLGARFRA